MAGSPREEERRALQLEAKEASFRRLRKNAFRSLRLSKSNIARMGSHRSRSRSPVERSHRHRSGGAPPDGVATIDAEDYFLRSNEFRNWLHEEKDRRLDELRGEDARKYVNLSNDPERSLTRTQGTSKSSRGVGMLGNSRRNTTLVV